MKFFEFFFHPMALAYILSGYMGAFLFLVPIAFAWVLVAWLTGVTDMNEWLDAHRSLAERTVLIFGGFMSASIAYYEGRRNPKPKPDYPVLK